MQAYLWISLGAVIGACLRYLVSRSAAALSVTFPYGTLAINVSGSFLLAWFLVWTGERVLVDPRWRLFFAVGFCGAYTTFSSYAFESLALFEQGQWMLLAVNVIANNLLCFAAVIAGAALARAL